jgi:hypothetical protein
LVPLKGHKMANAKSLRKRIALVAAAALGVGLLAAAPASATAGSLPVVGVAANQAVAPGAVATSSTVFSFTGAVATDIATLSAVLSVKPVGSAKVNADITFGAAASAPVNSTWTPGTGVLLDSTGAANVGSVSVTVPVLFTPDITGSYTIVLTGTAGTTATRTFTVTATSAAALATTPSISAIGVTSPTSPLAGQSAAFTIAVTNGTAITAGTADAYSIKAVITSAPAGGISPFTGAFVPVTGWVDGLYNTNAGASGAGKLTAVVSSLTPIAAATTTSIGTLAFTPAVAGTYAVSFYHDTSADGVINNGEVFQTASIVVGAATPVAAYSAGYSSAYIAAGAAQGISPDAVINYSMALPSAQAGNITVTLMNALNAAINGESLSATVAGPGLIGITDANGTYSTPSTGRAISLTLADNIANISVWSDGTAGATTVTISVTDATTHATTVLATKTLSFYGAVATVTTLQKVLVVGANGLTAGTNSATAGNLTFADTPAVVVTLKDANGNVVPNLAGSISGLSSNTAILASVATVNQDTTTGLTNGGPGNYNSAVTSAGLSTSGESATITYRYTADAGVTYISATPLTFTLGGTVASVTMALDAATYAPGAKAVLTVSAKDSAGNAVADGTYATLFTTAGVTTNAAISGTLPGASVTLLSGVNKTTFFVPVSPMAFTVSGTLGASVATAIQGTVVSATATITGSTTGGLSAADSAAIAAAKASADAATAAVAALSTTVASLIASITAQIRALSAQIAKLAGGKTPGLPKTGTKK